MDMHFSLSDILPILSGEPDQLRAKLEAFYASSHAQEALIGGATEHSKEQYNMNREMQIIDARYRAEHALLSAIASGNETSAFQALWDYSLLMQSPTQLPVPTSSNGLREFKNSVHTMNTLCRKAIEGNHLHPI